MLFKYGVALLVSETVMSKAGQKRYTQKAGTQSSSTE